MRNAYYYEESSIRHERERFYTMRGSVSDSGSWNATRLEPLDIKEEVHETEPETVEPLIFDPKELDI